MAKLNKTCVVDKEKYSYCPSCSSDRSKPSWHNLFCSENCHNIYIICTEYRDGIIDISTAKERIEKCDLSKLEHMGEGTKKQINEIRNYKETKEVKEVKEVKETENKKNVVASSAINSKKIFSNKK